MATTLVFDGGNLLVVDLELDEAWDLLRRALSRNSGMVKLKAPDGRQIVINAAQVMLLRPADKDHLWGAHAWPKGEVWAED